MGRAHAQQKTTPTRFGGGVLTPQDVHTLAWLLPKDKFNRMCQEISGHIEVLSVHALGGDGS